jgi:hypothetical protein
MSQFCNIFASDFMTISPTVPYTGTTKRGVPEQGRGKGSPQYNVQEAAIGICSVARYLRPDQTDASESMDKGLVTFIGSSRVRNSIGPMT